MFQNGTIAESAVKLWDIIKLCQIFVQKMKKILVQRASSIYFSELCQVPETKHKNFFLAFLKYYILKKKLFVKYHYLFHF